MSDTPTGSGSPASSVPAAFQPAHTRTLSSHHTRTLSSTHNVPTVQTVELAPHTQQLTSVPPELPQLTVTTPTTAYSAYTTQSTPSSFGTTAGSPPFSPPAPVPDVPTLPEQHRRVQPSIEIVPANPVSPAGTTLTMPSVIVTNPTPPPHQARFASPMMANPNAPVLPRLATPGSAVTSANIARKPVPLIVTSGPANARLGAKSSSPPLRVSPGSGGKQWSPPSKPYVAGSISTMSPVAAARSFNNRRSMQAAHPFAADAGDRVDSPTVATSTLYKATRNRDKADISTADRIVGRETLFDLDVDEKGTGDARELPLKDLLADELPEYIQVYLTPHPEREGVGATHAFGDKEKLGALDEKAELSEKGKEAQDYERRAANWNDLEATLPAYKSTASVHRSGTPDSAKKSSKRRRYIPTKSTNRIIFYVFLFFFLLVLPLGIFGIVYGLDHKSKSHHESAVGASQPDAQAPLADGTIVPLATVAAADSSGDIQVAITGRDDEDGGGN